MHKESRRQTQGRIYMNNACPIFLKAMSLLDRTNARKSSFSALAATEDSWPGNDGSWRRGRAAEPHTCQMICHYRGVSTQLSPPNHPSYPLSHPPPSPTRLNSSSPRTPPCIPQAAPVSLAALPLHLPLLHALPWEKMYPCERRSTLKSLFGCAMRAYTPPCVYPHNSLVCIHVYLGAELFVTIPEASRRSRIMPAEKLWLGPGYDPETKPPADKPNTKKPLSQVYYICQQRSFTITGQRSHSFPLNAVSFGTCERVR